MTGHEAVQYLTASIHNGKMKLIYFNLSQHRHFAPYDLTSASKEKVTFYIIKVVFVHKLIFISRYFLLLSL